MWSFVTDFFTYSNVFKVCTSSMYQYFVPFYCQIIFHCMKML
jgi:hypothetical protein